MTQISIVVPVYNVEKYICECIDSILCQSYVDWELILVDDGSPDRCGIICDEYAIKDSRIKVIHKKNGGLSDARNCAIDSIKGKYITFIDSDDLVSNYYLATLYKIIIEEKADVVQCELATDLKTLDANDIKIKYTSLHDDEILRRFLRFKEPTVFACGKLYKSDLFRKVRFPVGIIDEDNYTTFKIFKESNTLVSVNSKLYYYRQNESSITHRKFGIEKFGILGCVEEIHKYLGDNLKDFNEDLLYYEMRQLIQVYNNAVSANAENEFEEELKKIRNRIIELNSIVDNIDMKYKTIIWSIHYIRALYKQVVRKRRK